MDWSARTVPWNWARVRIVAELPTCQNTLQAVAPPVMVMREPEPIFRVEAAWNTQTESAVPARVRAPLFARASSPPW